MATKKSSNTVPRAFTRAAPPKPVQHPPQEKDFLDADRREVICSAACESLDWLSILQTLVESDSFDPHTLSRRLPGILGRLDELSSVVLSGIDDPSHPTATLRQCLAFLPSGANDAH